MHIGNLQGDIEEAMNPQGDPYRKELDELMHFRKLMLIYRLVHYKDIITEIHIGIKRRNKELCKSYIQLFYGSNVQQEIEDTLQNSCTQNNRKSTSQESVLLQIVMDLISSGNLTISVSAIWYKITNTLEGREDD